MPPANRVYVPGNKPPVIGRCDKCLYWKHVEGSMDTGTCRRRPPRVFAVVQDDGETGYETVFPRTVMDEGCGEFDNRSTSQMNAGDHSHQRTRMSDG